MTEAPVFVRQPNPYRSSAPERSEVLSDPGFGVQFTDHMVTVKWTARQGWQNAQLRPFGPLEVLPGASALQYAQQVFEGLKAYRHPDGSVWTFRPLLNAARLRASAKRSLLPAPDDTLFLESVRQLVTADCAWVPEPGR